MNNIIDADYTPKYRDAAEYVDGVRKLRRKRDRMRTVWVQRLFAASLALLIGVSLVALGVSLG